MSSLTPRQNEALEFITAYSSENGVIPSYVEIADSLGLKSKSGVHRLVRGLEKRGAIRRKPYLNRSIVVIEDRATSHLKAILAEIGKAGAVDRDSPCVVKAMRFLGRRR